MSKQKAPKGASASESQDTVTDSRFTSFTTDPRFRLPSKKNTRTKIDKRFSRMLKDDDFSNTATVDKYGRKLSHTSKKQALQRLYQPEEGSEDESGDEDEEIEVEDDEVVAKELRRAEAGYDAARGGGFSSSDDDDEEDDEEDEVIDADGSTEVGAFPDMQAEQEGVPMGEVSKRIAVVNLDWDNITSADLMAVMSSFTQGGRIQRVSVYKSEFGRERMEREDMEGPPSFGPQPQEDSESEADPEDDSEDEEAADERIKKELLQEDEGKEYDSAALRQYQLDRLRYYYAVVVCSDEGTALKIYEATDGSEYLNSANFFDLRFIPDDVEFDETPRDECEKIPDNYRPKDFVTEALQHSKVKLTWDAEDSTRKEAIKHAFSGSRAEIGENDLRAYLGSDSSDDDEEEVAEDEVEPNNVPKLTKKELARQKMRAALGLADEPTKAVSKSAKGPVGDMEITFTSGLSAKGSGSVFQNEPIKEETTAEAYIRKEKERKARRKEKAKAVREGRDPDAPQEVDEGAAEPEADLGFDDPFFETDAKVKDKAAKSIRKEERSKRREEKKAEAEAKESNRAELELLMADNTDAAKDRLDHFDINEIARMEKKKRQRSKKMSKGKQEVEGGKRGGMQEGFEMDVADPRFKAVFESHEFAIDPSNPRFKNTESMQKLLEEGRKKRKAGDGEDEEVGEVRKKSKAEKPLKEAGLQALVDKVKKSTRK